MTLGVGTTNELDASGLGAALDDRGSTTTAVRVDEVAVPEGVPGAADSPEQPARPTNTAVMRATANFLAIGSTPLAASLQSEHDNFHPRRSEARLRNVDNSMSTSRGRRVATRVMDRTPRWRLHGGRRQH